MDSVNLQRARTSDPWITPFTPRTHSGERKERCPSSSSKQERQFAPKALELEIMCWSYSQLEQMQSPSTVTRPQQASGELKLIWLVVFHTLPFTVDLWNKSETHSWGQPCRHRPSVARWTFHDIKCELSLWQISTFPPPNIHLLIKSWNRSWQPTETNSMWIRLRHST